MVEIVKKLNINKHPRDCDNYSLVCAGNIKLTHDKHAVTNEESIANNDVILNAIQNYSIVGVIPINTSLIIFTNKNNGTIYRYNEKENTCVEVNNKWKWSGGKIKGTYTKNVNNNLIIAVAEYDKHELCPTPVPKHNGDVPLKIINIDDSNDIFPAGELSYAVSPIVPYSVIHSFNYVDGYTYKGYYEFYIRYKISSNKYTQWFLLNGKPLVDVTELKNIVTFIHPDKLEENVGVSTDYLYRLVSNGHFDFVSDDSDFCKAALCANLKFIYPNNCPSYKEYQLAYIVTSKTYNKCFRTNDITIADGTHNDTYVVNPKAEIEYSMDELIIDYYNYYNVRQITNYKNRLYIADYKEHSLIPNNITSILNNISISGNEVSAIGNNEQQANTRTLIVKWDYYIEFRSYENGKLAENDSPYKGLDTITVDGYDYLLFPLKYVVGDDGDGHPTVAHTCTLHLRDSSTINVSGSQDYIGIRKIEGTISSNNNIFIKYEDSSNFTTYDINDLAYFEISPHMCVSGEDTYNRFTLDDFAGTILKSIDGGSNPKALEDILNNFLIPNEIYSFYIHFINKFGHISQGIKIDTDKFDDTYYSIYTNINGDKFVRIKQLGDFKTITPTISISNSALTNSEYVAAFISYRKFEKTNKLHGLLYDGRKFTNGIINYDDKVDIGINKRKDFFDNSATINNPVWNTYLQNKEDDTDNNTRQTKYTFLNKNVTNSDYVILEANVVPSIKVANDAVADNVGKESYLYMSANDTPNDNHTPILTTYAEEMTFDSGRKYMGEDRILIPTSLIILRNNKSYDNCTGYNGFLAFDSAIIYSKEGFMLNTIDGKIKNVTGDKIISNAESGSESWSIQPYDPYMCYIFHYIWDYPLHVRRFKNSPKVTVIVPSEDAKFAAEAKRLADEEDWSGLVSFLNDPYETGIQTIVQTLVEPKDSIDLYEYPHPNKSDVGSVKILTSYNKDDLNVTEYKQTIRRSNVLGDETKEIGWRRFPVEGYKNINENKGKITNIIGLGHYFFAHTEHSLFVFDIDSAIHAEDKDIQMYQPDVFEVDYKEVFTSDKGYGGLQDDLAWCVGEFGYIFYNNDFNRFYRFDNDKLAYIDESIINYLLNKKPKNVRFGIDKFNARLLICFNDDTRKTLSYDYELNNFISWHNYTFIQAFNTKTKVYYLHNNYSYLANYIEDSFGTYVNYASNPYIPYGVSDNNCNFGIDIIVNTEYDILKMLEFITYDCRKEKVDIDEVDKQDRNYRYHPYSGNILRIYNEDCDTDEMNINVENQANFNRFNNYKKPYYELARWNFNYFRDKITTNPSVNISDKLRRMHGKYYIFKFIFNRDATKRVEFENLDCKFSLYR